MDSPTTADGRSTPPPSRHTTKCPHPQGQGQQHPSNHQSPTRQPNPAPTHPTHRHRSTHPRRWGCPCHPHHRGHQAPDRSAAGSTCSPSSCRRTSTLLQSPEHPTSPRTDPSAQPPANRGTPTPSHSTTTPHSTSGSCACPLWWEPQTASGCRPRTSPH